MRGGAPPFELSGRRETRAELIRTRGVLPYDEPAAEGRQRSRWALIGGLRAARGPRLPGP